MVKAVCVNRYQRVRPMRLTIKLIVVIRLASLLAQLKDLPQLIPIRVMLDG